MTWREIRASFLEYFERNGHRVVPSSSLVPHEDPSLLFTNAGMNQFKDVFLGKEQRDYKRAASCQKCMRVSGKHNDLENVGPSPSHHTFFQMLGNFSFGDYFKKDAIGCAWELLTGVWKIPADKLFVTVFKGEGGIPRDVEAREFWLKHVSEDHLSELGSDDNFWQMGETGPCGRCSEIYYFRGNHIPCPEPVCRGVECSCSRYIEIWNNVFMEFDRQANGDLKPLPAPSIDTGMGLERITAVLQDKESNYDTDLFRPILDAISNHAGLHYGARFVPKVSLPSDSMSREQQAEFLNTSMRVVADHLRSMTFLIADGVTPSNEGRGYVLRKIMRRAMRHGMRLGLTDPFLYMLTDVVVTEMHEAYPELLSSQETIAQVVRDEERRFGVALRDGLPKLEDALDQAVTRPESFISGEEAFRLYETFGLPLDFIEDLAEQRHVKVDHIGFNEAIEAQKEKARAASNFKAGEHETWYISDKLLPKLLKTGDEFKGYDTTVVRDAEVIAIYGDGANGPTPQRKLESGDKGYVALSATPFYVESGGQVSDIGSLSSETAKLAVEDVLRIPGNAPIPRLHRVSVRAGSVTEGDKVLAQVDVTTRDATRRNHTATHLLHAGLRKVLGAHVKQKGSLVAPERLRFDFIHSSALSHEQIREVERLVNEQIQRDTEVRTTTMSQQEAIASGAMALFGEKYGDRVRVVSIPEFSMELCGGTHCRRTGEIGFFTIASEGGVAAGVRRIEAVTGSNAVQHHQATRAMLEDLLGALGTTADRGRAAIEHLQSENKRLAREVSKQRVASVEGLKDAFRRFEFDGITFEIATVEGLEKGSLRELVDSRRIKLGSGVVIAAAVFRDKAQLAAGVTPDLTSRINAGSLIKALAPIVGGRGGGRADFAEAGGKDSSRVEKELEAESRKAVEGLIAAGPGKQG